MSRQNFVSLRAPKLEARSNHADCSTGTRLHLAFDYVESFAANSLRLHSASSNARHTRGKKESRNNATLYFLIAI